MGHSRRPVHKEPEALSQVSLLSLCWPPSSPFCMWSLHAFIVAILTMLVRKFWAQPIVSGKEGGHMSERYCEMFPSSHLSPSPTAPVHPCGFGYQLSDYSVTATVCRQQRQHYWLVMACRSLSLFHLWAGGGKILYRYGRCVAAGLMFTPKLTLIPTYMLVQSYEFYRHETLKFC